MALSVPFNFPTHVGRELEYIEQTIKEAHKLSGDGAYTRASEETLQNITGASRALLTGSCTHALEIAALLLKLQPGDEVILPSFTFVSTANAFVLRGAKPVFVDIRPDTLNLDESLLEAAITPRTRAIVVVHYAGVACEMDAIQQIADQHGLAVIEDAAHALFATYKGKPLGSLGDMGTLSFHETKNVICGEGGALLLKRPQDIEAAEIIREKGTNRAQFYRGMVDKYSWIDVGSSYLMSEITAAFLYGQLEARDRIQQQRQAVWHTYQRELAGWSEQTGIRLPIVPDYCQPPAHIFYVLAHNLEERTALIAHLREHKIKTVFHYVPLHTAPMGQSLGYAPGDLPITERTSDTLIRLPLFATMTLDQAARVVEVISRFR